MQSTVGKLATLALLAMTYSGVSVNTISAQPADIPRPLVTPDSIETSIGELRFDRGAPSDDTIEKIYHQIDFQNASRAFSDTFQGVSIRGIHKGLLDAEVKDNEGIIFSELMDAKSLWLTTNADTIYAVGALDLTNGPMVLEVPPRFLGASQLCFCYCMSSSGMERGHCLRFAEPPRGHTVPRLRGGR